MVGFMAVFKNKYTRRRENNTRRLYMIHLEREPKKKEWNIYGETKRKTEKISNKMMEKIKW